MMASRLLTAIALSAVMAAGATGAASAADRSSLAAFVRSCQTDTKGCHNFTHDIVAAAQNANYACIPKDLSADDAGDQVLTWMKETANRDSKYADMPLEDVVWAGVDALWACKTP
jgi:hypothetical protein